MIIYTQDLEGLKNFYRQVFDFAVSEACYSIRTSNYIKLRRDETELLLIEAKITDTADNRNKIVARGPICFRPVFLIEESMADCREKTIICGGSFDPDHKEWENLGYQVCKGTDIEGNVFEVRSALR